MSKVFPLAGWRSGSGRFGARTVVDEVPVPDPGGGGGGGGGGTPPPDPTQEPGGTWGLDVTIDGIRYNRTGTVFDLANEADQTTDTSFDETFASTRRIDCTGTTWINDENYSLRKVGNGDDITIRGGEFIGQLEEWDGSDGAPWENSDANIGLPFSSTETDYHGSGCILNARGKRRLIELVTVRNRGDSISFAKASPNAMNAGDGWVVRYCALMDGKDDGIENDWKDSGTIYKCFISSMVIISTRPGNGQTPMSVNTSNKRLVLDGNLLWLKPCRFPDMQPVGGDPGDPGVFGFHKWQTNSSTTPEDDSINAMHAVLRNNTYRWDGEAHMTEGTNNIWGSLQTSKIDLQSNNVLLMPNHSSGLPPGWPTSGISSFTYLYAAAARTDWNTKMTAFKAAYPSLNIVNDGMF